MKRFCDKLHAKVGDLWWYSLMIFVACRSGDVIQAFIGLWLVPKYVGPEELGAVMPLQNLSGFFAAPLAVIAAVFAKYVNTYATKGELGKVKSFIQDVIRTSCVSFVACTLIAHLAAPFFYERLRIADGMLTILVLTSGFVVNISLLFTNALQGLKKFKTMAVVNFIGAPIRLATLLVAMPFRALSGYVLGQTTPPVASSCIALFSLRKGFLHVASDVTWRKDLPEMLRYAFPVAVWTIGCIIYNTVFTTLIRQRLPEVESAAYYLLSKFAEIGGYAGMSAMVILFPLASEAHEKGREDSRHLKHAIWGSIGFCAILAVAFTLFGRQLLGLVPIWKPCLNHIGILAILTVTVGISCAIGSYVTYEMACRRFRPIWIIVVTNFLWVGLLICLMGHGAFIGILPDGLVTWMTDLNAASLPFVVQGGLCCSIIQLALVMAVSGPKGEK